MDKKMLAIIFSLPLLLTSCQQKSEKEVQMLRLNFQEGDIPTLHPHVLERHVRGRVIGKTLFEGLTRINAEGEAELAGAQSVDISSCQTQYTFTLRDHRWSDGNEVTAFQYEKAWKQAIAPTSDCVRADLFYVIKEAKKAKEGTLSLDEVGVKALDEKTLFVKLAYPAPFFLKLVASSIFAPIERTEKEPFRFNGPFMVDTWKRDDRLVLQANPHFWDYDSGSLKKIEIQMVTDPFTNLLMYEKQKIDWMGDPCCRLTSEMVTQLQQEEVLQQCSIARARVIYINTECPFLVSAKIRQAFSLAIDRSLIVEHIYPCNLPLYQPLPPSLSLCSNILSDNSSVRSNLLFEEGLREIKLSKENFPSLILSYPNIAGFKQLAEYLKETWEKVLGITVHIEGAEWNVFRNNVERGKFHMGICDVGPLYPDPSEVLERYETMQIANILRWEHPTYQEKLHLARQMPQTRTQFLTEAEELLLEEMPFIPICSLNALFAHHPKLKEYVFDHAGCVDFRWAYFEE